LLYFDFLCQEKRQNDQGQNNLSGQEWFARSKMYCPCQDVQLFAAKDSETVNLQVAEAKNGLNHFSWN